MSEKPRVIVHLDLDAFFASVEMVENPVLEGKPVVVGGSPRERGVVAAASYPARVYGIRSAMPMYQAVKLCPDLVIVPPRHRRYQEYSQRVMAILHSATSLVEQISIDEAFLDLTYHVQEWGDSIGIAERLQKQVRQKVGLTASLGVASNKLVAKVASDRDKPFGLTVVRPSESAAFLAPLSVRVLWGIGPVTADKLGHMGVVTVGDLCQIPMKILEQAFGQRGREIAQMALGIDNRPIVTEHSRKSVSQERTFSQDISDAQELRDQLTRIGTRVAQLLLRKDLLARTVALKVRYSDFTTVTRQIQLAEATNSSVTICHVAQVLLTRLWTPDTRVRLLGVVARDLEKPTGQLTFLHQLEGGSTKIEQ